MTQFTTGEFKRAYDSLPSTGGELEGEGVQALGKWKPTKPCVVKALKGGQRLHFKVWMIDGDVDGFDLDDQQDAYGDPRNGILLEDDGPAHPEPSWYTDRRFVWHGVEMIQTTGGVLGKAPNYGKNIGFSTLSGPGGVFELKRAYIHHIGTRDNMKHGLYLQDRGFVGEDIVVGYCSDRAFQNRGAIAATVNRFITFRCGCGTMFGDTEGIPGGASSNIYTNGLAFPALTPGRYAIESYQDGSNNVWQGFLADGAKIQSGIQGVDVSRAIPITNHGFDLDTVTFQPGSPLLAKPGLVPLWLTKPAGPPPPPPPTVDVPGAVTDLELAETEIRLTDIYKKLRSGALTTAQYQATHTGKAEQAVAAALTKLGA